MGDRGHEPQKRFGFHRRASACIPDSKPFRHREPPPVTIKVALHHKTRYDYDRLVGLSPHEVRLRPAAHCRTPIESYSLKVKPAKHFLNWQQDPYGNWVARLVFPDKARELEIVVDLVADMTVINPFDFFVDPAAEQ